MGQAAVATRSRAEAAPRQKQDAQAQRPPAVVAIEGMAKLASGGASPDLMRTSVAGVIQQWLAEGLDESEMRERLEQLQADLDGGVENVENAAADAETEGQRKAAAGQKTALVAARDAVDQVLDKLAA